MAVFGEKGIERKIHDIRGENFRPKIQQDLAKLKGRYGIGVIGYDIQPVLLSSRHGVFSIVINGNISNLDEIVAELQGQGTNFAEIQPDFGISRAGVFCRAFTTRQFVNIRVEICFSWIFNRAAVTGPHQ